MIRIYNNKKYVYIYKYIDIDMSHNICIYLYVNIFPSKVVYEDIDIYYRFLTKTYGKSTVIFCSIYKGRFLSAGCYSDSPSIISVAN